MKLVASAAILLLAGCPRPKPAEPVEDPKPEPADPEPPTAAGDPFCDALAAAIISATENFEGATVEGTETGEGAVQLWDTSLRMPGSSSVDVSFVHGAGQWTAMFEGEAETMTSLLAQITPCVLTTHAFQEEAEPIDDDDDGVPEDYQWVDRAGVTLELVRHLEDDGVELVVYAPS